MILTQPECLTAAQRYTGVWSLIGTRKRRPRIFASIGLLSRATVFGDFLSVTAPDPDHSAD